MISDEAASLAALLSGSFDLIEEMPYHGIKQVESSGRFHIQRGISSRVVYLAMDQMGNLLPERLILMMDKKIIPATT